MSLKPEAPRMYVNITNEQYDEIRVILDSDRYRSGDVSKLVARLRELHKENGGDFDYRMAMLGKTTDLRIIDKPRDLKHIRFEVTTDREAARG